MILTAIHVRLQIKPIPVMDAKNQSLINFIQPLISIGILDVLFVKNAKSLLKIASL
jgi:hypothetical protein